jgi:hypothetical protein
VRGHGIVGEFEVLAEHAQQVLFQTHGQRMNPAVENDIRTFVAHLRRVARREVLYVRRRAEMTAQPMRRRLAMWRSIWVPSTSSGCAS